MTTPGAWVVVGPDSESERMVPINGRLLVGRECAGADSWSSLIVDDPAVSRNHLEIRAGRSIAPTLVDLSTNGTRVNGRRVERGQSVELADGDRVELGSIQLVFRAGDEETPVQHVFKSTIRVTGATTLAIVVGDIVAYTGLVERHGGVALAEATDSLFAAVGELLLQHQGTVSNYVGDAIFAAWDAIRNPHAPAQAVNFALAADELVRAQASTMAITYSDGEPLRMGWAVTLGEAGVGGPTAGREALHGDAVILAFRLAGLAARDGRPAVLVSTPIAEATPGTAVFGDPQEIWPKGYTSATRVHSATKR